jgi:hypothetical protein
MMFRRKYENPVIMFDPAKWSDQTKLRFMKFNVLVNYILPVWLLHRLNASKSIQERRAAEKERQRKLREKQK